MHAKALCNTRHFVRPRILVKLATYKLSLSALTGQTKCKQTQLLVASWTRIRGPSKNVSVASFSNDSGMNQVTFLHSSFIIESFGQVFSFLHLDSINNHLMVKQNWTMCWICHDIKFSKCSTYLDSDVLLSWSRKRKWKGTLMRDGLTNYFAAKSFPQSFINYYEYWVVTHVVFTIFFAIKFCLSLAQVKRKFIILPRFHPNLTL